MSEIPKPMSEIPKPMSEFPKSQENLLNNYYDTKKKYKLASTFKINSVTAFQIASDKLKSLDDKSSDFVQGIVRVDNCRKCVNNAFLKYCDVNAKLKQLEELLYQHSTMKQLVLQCWEEEDADLYCESPPNHSPKLNKISLL